MVSSLLGHGMPLETQLEMALHVAPFREQDAVHHRVTYRPVPAGGMMPDHAVLLRAQSLDGALGAEVEVVRAQADDPAAEGLERVREEQELAGRVDVGPLPALRVPRVADLDAVDRGHDVVIARRADD